MPRLLAISRFQLFSQWRHTVTAIGTTIIVITWHEILASDRKKVSSKKGKFVFIKFVRIEDCKNRTFRATVGKKTLALFSISRK